MTSDDMIDTGESEIGCEVWGHKYVITSLLEIAVCGKIKPRDLGAKLAVPSTYPHSRPRVMSAWEDP